MNNNKSFETITDLVRTIQKLEQEGVDLSVDDINTVRKEKTYLGYSNPVSIEEGTGSMIGKYK